MSNKTAPTADEAAKRRARRRSIADYPVTMDTLAKTLDEARIEYNSVHDRGVAKATTRLRTLMKKLIAESRAVYKEALDKRKEFKAKRKAEAAAQPSAGTTEE